MELFCFGSEDALLSNTNSLKQCKVELQLRKGKETIWFYDFELQKCLTFSASQLKLFFCLLPDLLKNESVATLIIQPVLDINFPHIFQLLDITCHIWIRPFTLSMVFKYLLFNDTKWRKYFALIFGISFSIWGRGSVLYLQVIWAFKLKDKIFRSTLDWCKTISKICG